MEAASDDIESHLSAVPVTVECPDSGDIESRLSAVPEIVECPDSDDEREVAQALDSSSMTGIEDSSDEEDGRVDKDDIPDHYKTSNTSVCSVVQLMIMVILAAGLGCSLRIEVLKLQRVFEMELWKWNVMALVVISGRLVAGWGVRICVYFMERNFVLRKRVLYFVYGLKNSVQNLVWLMMGFVAWQWVFDEKVPRLNTKFLVYITRFWACVLVSTLLCLAKTLAVKILASWFHVNTFFDKIQESLFSQYVIQALSGTPLVKTEVEQEQEQKRRRLLGPVRKRKKERNSITLENLYKFKQRNISAWNMKKLMSIVKQGVFSTLDEATVHITNEYQARIAAKKIFLNVAANPGSRYIYMEDLMRFMREDEAKALQNTQLFQTGKVEDGISKHALKNWMVSVFKGRKALVSSLNDTNTVIKRLHNLLNFFVGILIIVISVLILEIVTKAFIILVVSQMALMVFFCGDTCKGMFESIIFLFVRHPFDVDDRVEIDGEQMVVKEMSLLSTDFLGDDNHVTTFPNNVLATKKIKRMSPSISTT